MNEKKNVGIIVEVNGEYFLQTSVVSDPRKKKMIQVGSAADKEKFANLVGQKVEIVLSEPVRTVIAIIGESKPPIKPVKIVCYAPAYNINASVVDQNLINQLARQFVNQGIINEAAAKKLTG